ncbi:heme/hemin ABC transporter substrate-binding protein [Corynebacterium freneyi]|uniref:Iron complex transport system substrate-binding protein n=1 Tax=Corynebacterium freneyi TaxID=134034 RepID=A0ABS4UB94_9CORY|nr:ABC transporter substrate-binding protein [Corynebacterium freneyi]MBP2333821.1 iron complex transport system substrate-binding protein [Corynebacterium freneyi]QXA52197.1 ABC transporter substrate-binding protein [Corynebacterium freneyi]WJZ04077.1 Hemin-binding periplasmic protein HmuT precursor [Corynebacterium freneyi]
MPTSLTRRPGAIATVLLCVVFIAGLAGCAGPNAGGNAGSGAGESASASADAASPAPAGHVSAQLPPEAPEVLLDDPRPTLPVTVDWDGTPVEVTSADRILTLDRAGALSRMVWALGLGDRLVGRDTATDFPGAADLPQVTPGGHTINAESILRLRPDVILTDGSIGPSRVLDTVAAAGIAVVRMPDQRTPDTIAQLAEQVATSVGLGEHGEEVGAAIVGKLDAATRAARDRADGRRMMLLYLRGTTVAMIAGPNSGASSLIERLGGVDAADGLGLDAAFTPLTPEALVKAAPDTVIVMSDGLESIGGPDGLNSLQGMAQTPAGANGSVIDVPDSQLLSFGPNTPRVIEAMADALYGKADS